MPTATVYFGGAQGINPYGISMLTFTPIGGFAGTLTLACSTLPNNATCTFSPATDTLAGSVVTGTVTIGTGSLAALSVPALPGRHAHTLQTSLAILLPGSLLALFGLARRRNITLRASLLLVLTVGMLGALGTLSGCGRQQQLRSKRNTGRQLHRSR